VINLRFVSLENLVNIHDWPRSRIDRLMRIIDALDMIVKCKLIPVNDKLSGKSMWKVITTVFENHDRITCEVFDRGVVRFLESFTALALRCDLDVSKQERFIDL